MLVLRHIPVYMLAASLFSLPFNSIYMIRPMGELGGGFGYLFAMLSFVLFFLFNNRSKLALMPKSIFYLYIVIISIILLQLVFSGVTIQESYLKHQSGLSRFFRSALVLVFCTMYAHAIYLALATSPKIVFRVLYVLILVVTFIGMIEWLSWYVPAVRGIYGKISSGLLHSYNGRGEYIVGKLQSVTFEGSSLGLFCGLFLPWYWTARNAYWGNIQVKVLDIVTLVCLLLAAFLSGRTGMLAALAYIVPYLFFLRDKKTFFSNILLIKLTVAALIIAPLIVMFSGSFWALADNAHLSVSNASRLGTVYANFSIFKQHALLGVGAGQYGFYAPDYLPDWALNYEFYRWLDDPTASFFPVFTLYVRILGELGIVAFALFMYTLWRILTQTINNCVANHSLTYLDKAIILSVFSCLLLIWTYGSYKMHNFWFLFAMFSYLRVYPPGLKLQASADKI